MGWHFLWIGGLLAGVAGMIPGIIIYSRIGLGRQWASSIGIRLERINRRQGERAMWRLLVSSIITAEILGLVFTALKPSSLWNALLFSVLLSWFALWQATMSLFFENRNWKWFGITALNQVLTFALMGALLYHSYVSSIVIIPR